MRRIWVAVVGIVAIAVSGCGGPSAPDDGSGASSGPGGTRTVRHAMGTTEVTGTPQRVVVLDTGELDSVLALGVTPVGSVTADAASGFPDHLADRTRDVRPVGTIGEPNLEAIAALQPDLILSNKVRDGEKYDRLSAIAPTVFAEKVGVAWKDNLRLAGDALGRRAEADRLLSDYAQKAAATGRAFGDPGRVEVSMVRFLASAVRLYGRGSFIGTILADAGFGRPQAQRVDRTFVEVSKEQLALADGDLVFYSAFGADGEQEQAALTAGPLWQRLPAVAQGRAHQVSDDLWYLGIGPIAAGRVLDDLAGHARPS